MILTDIMMSNNNTMAACHREVSEMLKETECVFCEHDNNSKLMGNT
jgi:hypothetical protein